MRWPTSCRRSPRRPSAATWPTRRCRRRCAACSPNHTLVLVNGKRRHTTASLAILGGPYQGGAGVDLNFIPVDSIDHVEVLTEGAAAQYGTDAIAGVINIILKKKPSRRQPQRIRTAATTPATARPTRSPATSASRRPSGSFINFTAEYREHEHTDRGDIDPRVVDPARIDPDEGGTSPNTNMPFAPGYPYLNKIFGDAAYEIKLVVGQRAASRSATTPRSTRSAPGATNTPHRSKTIVCRPAWPTRIPIPNEVTYFAPFGFSPREETEETDYSGRRPASRATPAPGTGTSRRPTAKTRSTCSRATRPTRRCSRRPAQTPTEFLRRHYTPTQWTSNLDIIKEIDIGMTSPMNLAFGAEYREEDLDGRAGRRSSRVTSKAASRSRASALSDSGSHDRDVTAAYVDVVISSRSRRCGSTSRAATRTTATSATPRWASSARATS